MSPRCRVALAVLLLGTAVHTAHALTFTVTSTGDTSDTSAGDGSCVASGGGCTLRAAIEEANAHADADMIAFDLPGSGVRTIAPASGLPFITAPVTIDGYTQPGSSANTTATGGLDAVPLVETDCSAASTCFVVNNGGTPGTVTIRGLVMNGASSTMIDLEAGTVTVIEGSFMGTDATGMLDKGGGTAVGMFVQGGALTFTVGGTTPAARNLISGSSGGAVSASANLSSSIMGTIQGNLIGTDKTGMAAIANGTGIAAGGAGSDTIVLMIGGAATGAGNVVSGNVNAGIDLGAFTAGSVIQGNLIGTAADGTSALGNGTKGIHVSDGPVTIGGTEAGDGNVIAFNGSDAFFHPAIHVETTDSGTRIAGNSIFSNAGIGIDLDPIGLTENDVGDPDLGANGRQNFPILDAGVFAGGSSVGGTLDSTPGTTFRVEVFANASCDPSGNGEGEAFVGVNDAVTTDGTGKATFTVSFAQPLPAGTILTATATAPDLSTSEFGPCTAAPPTTTTTTATTTTTTSTTATGTSTTVTTSTTTTSTTTVTTSSSTTTTVTTSTSTSAPPTSTTATTTTHAPTTTTTTSPPVGCAAVPAGATFPSIICRLQTVLTRISTAPIADAFKAKLAHTIEKGRDRAMEARDLCGTGNKRKPKARLKQVERQVIQYAHRLDGHARTNLDPTLRDELRAPAAALRADTHALRLRLQCPDDAAS